MATIKALEGRTVHQIQSGQVIVDLCSVAKELVENSLDAGATSIEIRFKNHGLDSIEVQDNGPGISSDNYETIALKHYTSKLASYDDLSSLETFGFRGEALSSLCALSHFHITTAREDEAPKGTRLEFETSGRLKGTAVVASQSGTTVSVENLFHNLPVRRRELEKNIKREYGKVLGILQAYACISTQARISVTNVMAKGKKAVVFGTKSASTTRDNIANVFGARTLTNLVAMDLSLQMEPTGTALRSKFAADHKPVQVIGHVSRPVFGEGRQAPDRQMFYVNSRPCNLPQFAKVFNEVYKSFNISQSPFIFANIIMNTDAYDVNVSPDKRTILLHEQGSLLEALKTSLVALFEEQDQTVPQSTLQSSRLPSYKKLTVSRETSANSVTDGIPTINLQRFESTADTDDRSGSDGSADEEETEDTSGLIGKFAARETTERSNSSVRRETTECGTDKLSKEKRKLGKENQKPADVDEYDGLRDRERPDASGKNLPRAVKDFNARLAEQAPDVSETAQPEPPPWVSRSRDEAESPAEVSANTPTASVVQNAFDRMRPRRPSPDVATITIGSQQTTSVLGPTVFSQRSARMTGTPSKAAAPASSTPQSQFSSSLQAFAAPGSSLQQTVGPTRTKVPPPKVQSVEANEQASEEEESGEDSPAESDSHDLEAAMEDRDSAPEDSDSAYEDEDEKKAREEMKVAHMIQELEDAAVVPSEARLAHATETLKGKVSARDSTTNLLQRIETSLASITHQLQTLTSSLSSFRPTHHPPSPTSKPDTTSPSKQQPHISPTPDATTLTITKSDFPSLHIVGQFNLGFILAVRPRTNDLFIIDQHASDEITNFSRLSQQTRMQDQRLVHPLPLSLSAVDEEIVLQNLDALTLNGFGVSVDESDDQPIGSRIALQSLPMSKETTFSPRDFEELIALLGERTGRADVPRPSRIRKVFAMRACRMSVMVGKVMTGGMMRRLVAGMADVERPWNCPHGRPTMRHVCSLVGLGGCEDVEDDEEGRIDWGGYLEGLEDGDDGESEDDGEEDAEGDSKGDGVGGSQDGDEEEEYSFEVEH